jgi:cytochrome c oxidase subunit 2
VEIRGSQTSAFEVHVTAEQWKWTFDYPSLGIRADELHLPVGERAHLMIESKDVIHSLWLTPLGIKQDAVPGHPTEAYVSPTVAGSYSGACTELCGFGHTSMTFEIVTSDMTALQAWASTQKKIPPPHPPPPSGEPR